MLLLLSPLACEKNPGSLQKDKIQSVSVNRNCLSAAEMMHIYNLHCCLTKQDLFCRRPVIFRKSTWALKIQRQDNTMKHLMQKKKFPSLKHVITFLFPSLSLSSSPLKWIKKGWNQQRVIAFIWRKVSPNISHAACPVNTSSASLHLL